MAGNIQAKPFNAREFSGMASGPTPQRWRLIDLVMPVMQNVADVEGRPPRAKAFRPGRQHGTRAREPFELHPVHINRCYRGVARTGNLSCLIMRADCYHRDEYQARRVMRHREITTGPCSKAQAGQARGSGRRRVNILEGIAIELGQRRAVL